jgi:preprotein translocase subunit SecD
VAKQQARPGRRLVVFFLALAGVFALVALAGTWKPTLGLDLQGGTRITLNAKGDNVTADSLTEAANIIDSRVNGSGVTEAEVTTQGNQYVIVEIPGKSRPDLEETVKRQAQLRFRIVSRSEVGTSTTGGPSDSASTGPTTSPGAGVLLPSASASGKGSTSPNPDSASPASPKGRAAYQPNSKSSASPSDKASKSPAPGKSPSASPSGASADGTDQAALDDPLAWADNPSPEWVAKFDAFSCPPAGQAVDVEDNPDKPLITCDDSGIKYLLSPAMLEGTALKTASAGIPQGQVQWIVTLSFDGAGTKTFAEISRALYGTDKQFAIVLDGQVLSAPTMNGLILNGEAQIEGNFTEASAQSLATSLKFGALPIAFENDPLVETVGPSLAGNQLQAGITAGLLGLLLVMIYCLIYYRGLGLVVIASLLVAAALTYGMVLLLSKAAGFTLSLPGIAGLIVAVGITADSFIVYFERIRDEMRDGKSMRVAVEAGWVRARNTCLAADAVSLLAATVLYIFAAGVVKGFAFALGLSTLIDLAVFFWFTHPLVSWLATFAFFNKGHKLSGLDAENLGIDRLPAGGRA